MLNFIFWETFLVPNDITVITFKNEKISLDIRLNYNTNKFRAEYNGGRYK